ncbi:hypothetical protein BDR26DRAFT_856824 [Obelidium mucronatum]|nr:hypothetical protein BDR26DRAFT_856824 [Obelidium mucronatum]
MSFSQPANKLIFVGLGGYVVALNMDTGKQVWEATLHAVRNLRCLSASTGTQIWENKLTGIGIAPSYANSKVDPEDIVYVASNFIVKALSIKTWGCNIPFNRHHISSSSKPSLTDAIYFGANGYINITLSGVGYNSSDIIPLAHSGLALAASAINLRLYDLNSGGLVWENKLKGMGMGVLSLLAGSGVSPGSYSTNSQLSFDSLARVLYVSLWGQVRAIRMKDGEQLWNYSPSFKQKSFDANIFFEDDRVFVAGNGIVSCLDGRTGNVVWGQKKIRRGYTFISTVRSGNGETNRSCLFGNIYKRRTEDDAAAANAVTPAAVTAPAQ